MIDEAEVRAVINLRTDHLARALGAVRPFAHERTSDSEAGVILPWVRLFNRDAKFNRDVKSLVTEATDKRAVAWHRVPVVTRTGLLDVLISTREVDALLRAIRKLGKSRLRETAAVVEYVSGQVRVVLPGGDEYVPLEACPTERLKEFLLLNDWPLPDVWNSLSWPGRGLRLAIPGSRTRGQRGRITYSATLLGALAAAGKAIHPTGPPAPVIFHHADKLNRADLVTIDHDFLAVLLPMQESADLDLDGLRAEAKRILDGWKEELA